MATAPRVEVASEDLATLPQVVVIGGGFAGLATARALENRPVRVILVDRHNFHTFMPLLYQVATAGLEPADVAYPIRTIFGRAKNVQVRHASVGRIDRSNNVVLLDDGTEITYDFLVVATGATAAYFNIPGAATYALPLYTLADARRLRNRLLRSLEEAEVQDATSSGELCFAVVGGGPTGVETAGALAELVAIVIRRDGLRLDPTKVRVKLIDVAPRVLTAFPESASRYAQRELARLGVEVELDRSVVEVHEHALRLSDGTSLPTAAVIWAAGVTVSGTLAGELATGGPGGRAEVAADLRLAGSPNVFVVGDAAAIPTPTSVLPQLAPVAIQSGQHAAAQILRVVEGKATEPFVYHDKGMMATIGRRAAVAKLAHGVVIRGTLGWLAWLGLHLWYLIGFRNRLRVLINWTWRYFDWPSGPRLIVADAETAE